MLSKLHTTTKRVQYKNLKGKPNIGSTAVKVDIANLKTKQF